MASATSFTSKESFSTTLLATPELNTFQASTSTTSESGREAIRKDINKLLEQFDSIAASTNYNGTTLLQKSATDMAKADTFNFQIGEEKDFNVSMAPSKASNTENLGGGSNAIDAQAINAAAVDPVTGVSSQAGNNIAVNGSQVFNTSLGGDIILQDVDLAASGTEAAGGTVIMDINVSGKLGVMTAGTSVAIDISNQSQVVIDAINALATSSDDLAVAGTTATVTGTVDFGDLEFSSANMVASAVAETITFNDGDATDKGLISVKDNNTGTDKPLLGQINVSSTTSTNLTGGYTLDSIKSTAANGLSADKANAFMATIDEALTQMNANRSDYGSTQNQLESSIRNMQTTHTNLKAAESVVRDVDYAAESAAFNKQNIIAQAGTYAMSQANSMAQSVQKLLQ